MGGLLPVEEALRRLLADVAPIASESVDIGSSAGRVLATDLFALRTQPPFDASAMDGYAVRSADTATVPVVLKVIGESIAGKRFTGSVGADEAVRIFTGAPVPPGADAILLQEDAKPTPGGTVEVLEATQAGRHIRRSGLDFMTGDALLPAGRELDAAALSLAAAANHASLTVVRKPLVAILATGTELVPPGTETGPDQIVASNTFGVAALCRNAGAEILDLGIVPDDRALLSEAVSRALTRKADVIVTLGGASVGDHDLVREVLTGEGMALDFWRIKMRPGKPLMFGRFDQTRVLGLPGNPVSSLVCAHLFLLPLVAQLGGRTHKADIRKARLGTRMPANDHRQDYVRAIAQEENGELIVTPFARQDSSMLRTLAEANALIIRAADAAEAESGEACSVLMIR